ncbi:hypothetical protein Tco_1179104 [Tanacetum coccineum]
MKTKNLNKNWVTKRAVDILILNGNNIEFVMWNEMALNVNMELYEALPKPVLIVVSSCRVISTDKTNITRKPSKTGKHEHGNQKSTKEAKDSKPKPRKVNYGQASVKESQTLVNRSQPLEDKNPNVSI